MFLQLKPAAIFWCLLRQWQRNKIKNKTQKLLHTLKAKLKNNKIFTQSKNNY